MSPEARRPGEGAGLSDGIEIFPETDELRPESLATRFALLWVFTGEQERAGAGGIGITAADYTLDEQMVYLKRLPRVKESTCSK